VFFPTLKTAAETMGANGTADTTSSFPAIPHQNAVKPKLKLDKFIYFIANKICLKFFSS
jgi:hypothetical protein